MVSNREEAETKKRYLNHDVVALDDCKLFEGCGIWLGLNNTHQKEVISFLRKRELLRYVFLFHGEYAQHENLRETINSRKLTAEMEGWV